MNCPKCEKEFDENKIDVKWTKNGLKCKCPDCKEPLIIVRKARGLVRDETGKLIKRFKNA